MSIPEQLPHRFSGFEIEFMSEPSIEKRVKIIKLLSEMIGGDWIVERVFIDEHIFSLETNLSNVTHELAFNTAATLLSLDEVTYASPAFEFEEIDMTWDFDECSSARSVSAVNPELGANYEWHLEQIRAKEAWELPLNSDGAAMGACVDIGHIDTGYTEHYELVGDAEIAIEKGYNFYEKIQSSLEPLDTIDEGHGGATGSVLVSQQGASNSNPDVNFVSGVSPKSRLIPIRVDKNVWFLSPKRDVKGIMHALGEGCHVISLSRGGLGSRSLEIAVEKANTLGVIIVAAAGNCNLGCSVRAPAEYGSVICVGGTNSDAEPWESSSRGPEVNVCAPAHEVWRARTVKRNNDYYFDVAPSSGTSYATPLVAGAAALWIAYHGGHQKLSFKLRGVQNIPLAFEQLLNGLGSSKPGGHWDTDNFGAGIIDIVGLLQAPLPILLPYELENFAKSSVKVRNLDKRRLLDVLAANEDAGVRQLIDDELELLKLTTPSIANLYDNYVRNSISVDYFMEQLSQALTTQSISKLLKKKVVN